MYSKKNVSFNEVISYYYIPNNLDIKELKTHLWWSSFDYILFKNDYMIEIARNINKNEENNYLYNFNYNHQLKKYEMENEELYFT